MSKFPLSLSFDDVLIVPQFSTVVSRKDVSTDVSFLGQTLKLGIISSNMDTVTTSPMAKALGNYGALGALHRFQSIEDNVKMFHNSPKNTICSVGLGNKELERAEMLCNNGCTAILLDVANGANMEVVKQLKLLKEVLGTSSYFVVGNFATARNIKDFKYHSNEQVDAWKVGIGGGSACLTRKVSGCGLPTLASVIDCAAVGEPIIADGGIRSSDDFAKALAAGATCVMLGGMLAGTDEAPGEVVYGHKKYRGSASQESYEIQGKVSEWRAPEGDSFLVPYKGTVKGVLQGLEAGLRGSMSTVGANNLVEFRERAEFVQITHNGLQENFAHGKKS